MQGQAAAAAAAAAAATMQARMGGMGGMWPGLYHPAAAMAAAAMQQAQAQAQGQPQRASPPLQAAQIPFPGMYFHPQMLQPLHATSSSATPSPQTQALLAAASASGLGGPSKKKRSRRDVDDTESDADTGDLRKTASVSSLEDGHDLTGPGDEDEDDASSTGFGEDGRGLVLRRFRTGRWSKNEHERFLEGIRIHGTKRWVLVASHVRTRSTEQTRSHAQKFFIQNPTYKLRHQEETRGRQYRGAVRRAGAPRSGAGDIDADVDASPASGAFASGNGTGDGSLSEGSSSAA